MFRLISNKLFNIFKKFVFFLGNFIMKIRIFLLNLSPYIDIDYRIFLSSSAKIIVFNPDGCQKITGKVEISKGCKISDYVLIVPYGGKIVIEENVYIGPFTVLYGHGGLRIGKNTLIAAHSIIVPSNHIFDRVDIPINKQGLTCKGIQIGEDVWIGAGVKILDGVKIGNGCVIGAGSVVTQTFEDFSVVVGSPAKKIKDRGIE